MTTQFRPMTAMFAHRLGLIPHRSLLLRRAASQGLTSPSAFETLAWDYGCRYYPLRERVNLPARVHFSQGQIAIALMHPSFEWDPQRLRIAAAMVGALGNDPQQLARLAQQEQCVAPLTYIALAGQNAEPLQPFWTQLLNLLPACAPPPAGVMPHPSRFCALAGKSRPGTSLLSVSAWIRPSAA